MSKRYQFISRSLNYGIKGKTMFLKELDQIMVKQYGFDTTLKWGFQIVDNQIPEVGDETFFCWRTLKDKFENTDAIVISFFILSLDNPNNPRIKINTIEATS